MSKRSQVEEYVDLLIELSSDFTIGGRLGTVDGEMFELAKNPRILRKLRDQIKYASQEDESLRGYTPVDALGYVLMLRPDFEDATSLELTANLNFADLLVRLTWLHMKIYDKTEMAYHKKRSLQEASNALSDIDNGLSQGTLIATSELLANVNHIDEKLTQYCNSRDELRQIIFEAEEANVEIMKEIEGLLKICLQGCQTKLSYCQKFGVSFAYYKNSERCSRLGDLALPPAQCICSKSLARAVELCEDFDNKDILPYEKYWKLREILPKLNQAIEANRDVEDLAKLWQFVFERENDK